MKTYRVAILGCGGRGTAQARAIQLHPRAEVVALADLNAERLNKLGDQIGVTARYADFEQMIREQEPDIVNIPTASRFHASLAEAVLKLGRHVDVEKPMTCTLEELDRVTAAQRASGKQLAPHHQRALYPPTRKVRELVQQGYIGQPQMVRIRDKGYYGGYSVLQQGCHALAWAASIFGPARSVSTHMTTDGRPTTVEDVYEGPVGYGLICGEKHTSIYEMGGGVFVINEEHYRPKVSSSTLGFEVIGSEGALCVARAQGEMAFHSNDPFLNPAVMNWTPLPLTKEERTLAGFDYADPAVGQTADLWMVDEWVNALDEGRDLVINAAVGAATMEMIHGAFASHAEGRRIELPMADRAHPLERWLAHEGRPRPTPRPVTERYPEWVAWAQAEARRGAPAISARSC